jgi:hypothetical protein
MAYTKQPVATGEVVTALWGNNVQTQYDEVKAELSEEGTSDLAVDPSTVKLFNKVPSSPDSNGIYTVVDYKRISNDTLYMKSTLSGGTSPNYTTQRLQYYDSAGSVVIKTVTITRTYDSNGKVSSESVVIS